MDFQKRLRLFQLFTVAMVISAWSLMTYKSVENMQRGPRIYMNRDSGSSQ